MGRGCVNAAATEWAFLARSALAVLQRKALGRAPRSFERSGLQVGPPCRSRGAAGRDGQIRGRLSTAGATRRTGPPGRRLIPEGLAGQVCLDGGVPRLLSLSNEVTGAPMHLTRSPRIEYLALGREGNPDPPISPF